MGIHVQRNENKDLELRTQHLVGDHTDFNDKCPSCKEEAGVDQFTGEETAGPDKDWDKLPEVDTKSIMEEPLTEDNDTYSAAFSQLAHKKYTAAEIKNIVAAGPACEYVPGGKKGPKKAISSCGDTATHFVFKENLDPNVTNGIPNYWDDDDYGQFVCDHHADDAVADIDNNEINEVIDKNPGISSQDLQSKLTKFGTKIHLNDIEDSFLGPSPHKKRRYKYSYSTNLATHRARVFKGSEESPENFTDKARLLEPLENETPIEHVVRQARTITEKERAANALRQSSWRLRTKLGIEAAPYGKSGRRIAQDESGKAEVRTRDVSQALARAENILKVAGDPILKDENATAEEKIYRASIHAQSGLKFSGIDKSRTMQDNPTGTRTPGIDERLIRPATAISERLPFKSYAVAPVEDPTGVLNLGHDVFSLSPGPDRVSLFDSMREDAPKYVNSEGKVVDYVTGEENHPGISIINTDRGIVSDENPYRLTIKQHPQAGLITMWKGNVVHVHQIPHTENFYKLLTDHGLENIGKLPPEAFGRQLIDPVTRQPKYLYVPSTTPVNFKTAEGTDPAKLPELIRQTYAKSGTLSHRQEFDRRLKARMEASTAPVTDIGVFSGASQAANAERISGFLNGLDD